MHQPAIPTTLASRTRPCRNIAPGKALEHPRRRTLLDLIKAEPGLNVRSLARRTGYSMGVLLHHLTVLHRSGYTIRRRLGCQALIFPAASAHTALPNLLAEHVLDDFDQGVLRDLRAAGTAYQKDLVLPRLQAGVARSTVQNRLKRLVQRGLITETPQGRLLRYALAESLTRHPPRATPEMVAG